jgi:CDP-glucose 4,6-dehydratase
MLSQTFQNRSVFVTGHTGFKGSWLSIWLSQMGAKVTGFSLAPETEPNLFDSAAIEQKVASHIGDVRNFEALKNALATSNPDLIIHMAAQPLVRRSYREPVETMETNFNGTLNLLEAVRLRNKPCAVVVVTTDKCYRNEEQVWGYREHDPLGGDDPYSASKAAAEILVHSYRQSFFSADNQIRLASVRGGNVIGGGDWSEDRILPDLVRALNRGDSLEVRSPKAIRPWQHVLELLRGYLLVAARLLTSDDRKWCSTWNFGPLPGQDVPVGELVDQFCNIWGDGSWIDASRPNQLHEANILRLAIDKSVSELGWRPTWTVHEAVERTALWYRDYHSGRGALDLVLNDIATFGRAFE